MKPGWEQTEPKPRLLGTSAQMAALAWAGVMCAFHTLQRAKASAKPIAV